MAALPIKPEYGPSLGRLLEPSWRRASRGLRAGVIAAAVLLVAALLGAGLTLENASYSHGGRLPFSFDYRYLYRVQPEPGGYVKVDARWPNGELKYSYAVNPVLLPPYTGALEGEMPLYAAAYIRMLSARERGFVFRGEGKTRVSNKLVGYQIAYTAEVEGQQVFCRDVLLMPQREGAREGVNVAMKASPKANASVSSPLEVAESGVLLRPLKTFSFG